MKNLSNASAVCKLRNICNSLLNVQLRSDYSVKCGLFGDKYCQTPSLSHSVNGTLKFGVIKGIAFFAVLAVVVSALRTLMYCIRD